MLNVRCCGMDLRKRECSDPAPGHASAWHTYPTRAGRTRARICETVLCDVKADRGRCRRVSLQRQPIHAGSLQYKIIVRHDARRMLHQGRNTYLHHSLNLYQGRDAYLHRYAHFCWEASVHIAPSQGIYVCASDTRFCRWHRIVLLTSSPVQANTFNPAFAGVLRHPRLAGGGGR